MPRLTLPRWVRRALEAGIGGAIVAIASLVGSGLAAGPGPHALPDGIAGILLVAPAVLALAVVTTTWPVALAATREDAVMGAVAAFLVAADVTVILAAGRVLLDRSGISLGAGLLVAAVAAIPAVVGLVAAQVGVSLGFGRRAGAFCALGATVAAIVLLGILAIAA
jgi:hypothetical protein